MAMDHRLRWEDTRSFPEGGEAGTIDPPTRLDGAIDFAPLLTAGCVQESLSDAPRGDSLTFRSPKS